MKCLNIYSRVYTFCTSVAYSNDPQRPGSRNRPNRVPRGGNPGSIGAEFVGLDLYNHLKRFFQDYIENVYQVCAVYFNDLSR